jgi:hypothetical protein
MMVTAARSNNGRNQLTCIEKDKPKNNNKIRQHEKTNTSFNSFFPFSLFNPFFAQTITVVIVITVHCNNHQQRMQLALSPPLPPSPATKEPSIINHHCHHED